MAVYGISDAEMARRLHKSRQAVYNKRTGFTTITADDLAAIAEALNVDPTILLGPPAEALRWLADNRPDEVADPEPAKGDRSFRCTWRYSSRLSLLPRNDPSLLTLPMCDDKIEKPYVRAVAVGAVGPVGAACGTAATFQRKDIPPS